jgi:hypothetical protein
MQATVDYKLTEKYKENMKQLEVLLKTGTTDAAQWAKISLILHIKNKTKIYAPDHNVDSIKRGFRELYKHQSTGTSNYTNRTITKICDSLKEYARIGRG